MAIETLDPGQTADVNAVADLHFQFLADSPIAGLGERFVRSFFYTRLVQDGAVRVIFCRHDGRIVGFISYTPDPHGFMARGIRKHFVYLCWLMSTSLLMKPALLSGVRRALSMVRERGGQTEPADPRLGEVISMVTLPDYQKHVPEGGKGRLTVRLFEEMVAGFRALGYDRIHLMVKPENRASNIMCSVMGCQFEKVIIGGIPTHRYTFFLNGRTDAAAAGTPA